MNEEMFEGGAGDIFVIKAGEIHSFKAIGDGSLVQVDVHLSPRFIQENLGWWCYPSPLLATRYSLDNMGI